MTTKQEAIRVALEALEPFAKAFTWSRDQYAKRYGKDAEQGYKNFDAMPSVWKMESLAFSLDDLRRASAAHALLSQAEAVLASTPPKPAERSRINADYFNLILEECGFENSGYAAVQLCEFIEGKRDL